VRGSPCQHWLAGRPTRLCAALLSFYFVYQLFSICSVVFWLGGSFAILGNSVCLCEIANVPPIALA